MIMSLLQECKVTKGKCGNRWAANLPYRRLRWMVATNIQFVIASAARNLKNRQNGSCVYSLAGALRPQSVFVDW